MSGETTVLLLSKRLTAEEVEKIYEAEWQKAALIYPRLVFRQVDDFAVEIRFHQKSRTFTNIEQYKKIVRQAILKHHPDCVVR